MDGQTEEQTDRWKDCRRDRWADRQIMEQKKLKDVQIDEQTDRQTD